MDAFANVLFGRTLAIAVRRGVFEALAHGPMTEEHIGSATHLHPRALNLLLTSCVTGGYLDRRGDAYHLTAEGSKWLRKDSPESLVNLIAYFELLHAHWADLETSLQSGVPPRLYYEVFTGEEWRIYVLGMRDLARMLLPHVIGHILPGKEARTLLDIGGSHGLFSIECCRRRPALHATIMDFPPALEHASRFIQEAGVAGRVDVRGGNFLMEPLPPEQDVVLMFNIIHGLSEAENRALVGRALAALRPGGKLFILDQMREENSRASSLARFIPLMVGVNLLNEVGGTTYSVGQVRAWCGSRQIKRVRLRMPGVVLMEIST